MVDFTARGEIEDGAEEEEGGESGEDLEGSHVWDMLQGCSGIGTREGDSEVFRPICEAQVRDAGLYEYGELAGGELVDVTTSNCFDCCFE